MFGPVGLVKVTTHGAAAVPEPVTVVAMFVGCWGILEMVGRRLDRKKEAERAKEQEPIVKQ